jgi:glutathione S-transferase
MYRLHCFCQSGNSFKVALALGCMSQQWAPVFVDYLGGVTKTLEWRKQWNEMGEVPILEDDALKLTQSGAILRYLADKHGQYCGNNGVERREILRWLLYDNHKFSSYFISYRFMKSFGTTPPEPAVMDWLRMRIGQAFAPVEERLASLPFIIGEHPTIADFSMCGYLFFPEEETGLEVRTRYPNIARWLDRIGDIPGWAAPYEILPGHRLRPRW